VWLDMLSIDGKEDRKKGSSSDSKRSSSIISADRSGGVIGLRIQQRVDHNMLFRLCLKSSFLDTFSDGVRFRRGNGNFMCGEQWLDGLPCLDRSQWGIDLAQGDYDGIHRVDVDGSQLDGHALRTLPIMRWEVLSLIILFTLCICAVCGYALASRKQGVGLVEMIRRRRDGHRRVQSEDYSMDAGTGRTGVDSTEVDGNVVTTLHIPGQFKRVRATERTTMMDEDSQSDYDEHSVAVTH